MIEANKSTVLLFFASVLTLNLNATTLELTDDILRNVPESFETDEFFFRCPMPGDSKAYFSAIEETREDLELWMPWSRNTKTPADAEKMARKARIFFLARTNFVFYAYRKDNNDFVGGFNCYPRWDISQIEIGYWCRKKYQRKGYFTKIITAAVEFAFDILDAQRIEIKCNEANLPSKKLIERMGLEFEGKRRNVRLNADGTFGNELIFAKIRDNKKQHSE